MYLSWNFLNKHLNLEKITPAEFAERMTIAKIEVESFFPLAQGNGLVIGLVQSCIAHPESDHLHVCEVTIGTGVRTIVCGAPNIAAGQKVIVALPGAILPAKGVTIQHSTIRGVESDGMICSLAELGLPEKFLLGDGSEGIEVLSQEAPVGHLNPFHYLGYDDVMFELKPTPDRGDALSLESLLYEVSAVLNLPLIHPIVYPEIQPSKPSTYQCVTETSCCPYFSIQALSGIHIKPSPLWMQTFLLAHGIRSINNVVDIGNYVMLMTGQPLHMYDADKLPDKKFVVKQKLSGTFMALDGKPYPIQAHDLVVTCGDSFVSLAGVMGSQATVVDDSTKNIAIEAALFEGTVVRSTSQRLQLVSDASLRFSRGIDPTRSKNALALAISLLQSFAEAKEVEAIAETKNKPTEQPIVIPVHLQHVNQLLGTTFKEDEISKLFTRLGFCFEGSLSTTWLVSVPSYRPDLKIEADLIEEIIRIAGFERLPLSMPVLATSGERTLHQKKRLWLRNYLLGNSIDEALSYSLLPNDRSKDFMSLSSQKEDPAAIVQLALPMTSDRTCLRRSIVPSLLQAVQYNQAHGIPDVHLFEISHLYHTPERNTEHLAVVFSGQQPHAAWRQAAPLDFYTTKGIVEGILQLLGIESSRYGWTKVESSSANYHPGRSAYLMMGKEVVGVLGQIHPLMAKKYEVKETYVIELDLSALFALKTSKVKFSNPISYPTIRRDVALVLKDSTPVEELIQVIRKVGRRWVVAAEVFDVYRGSSLEAGKRSVAIMIRYQDSKRTLRDEEVNELHSKIMATLEIEFQATLRT